jgi:hypothetical protein
MEFKIGDTVGYKQEFVGTYKVISENPNDFWLQSLTFPNVYLKYSPEIMTKI